MNLENKVKELEKKVQQLEKKECHHKFERVSLGLADPVPKGQCKYCGAMIYWDSLFGWGIPINSITIIS